MTTRTSNGTATEDVNIVEGTDENDGLVGTDGVDKIFGLAGDDTLAGGACDDQLYGGAGTDTFYGGAGDDTFYGDSHSNRPEIDIFAYRKEEFGNDTIKDFNAGPVSEGGDFLAFLGSNVSLADLEITENEHGHAVVKMGKMGTITLENVSQTDLLENIEDNIAGLVGAEGIIGTRDDDVLSGTDGNDQIYGLAGDDTLSGGAGDDHMYGGRGDDTFAYDSRTFGNDNIMDFDVAEDKLDFTGSGLSFLDLEISENKDGDVVLARGNTGNSITLKGVSETALLENISNTIAGLAEVPGISHNFGSRNDDDLSGTAGDDLIYGLADNDTIKGLAGGDDIYGGRGDDTLYGGGDRDFVFGGAGKDTLHGDAGDDVLFGGAGDDTLDGGDGRDIFAYVSATFGNDTIEGFSVEEDKLDFTGSELKFSDLEITDGESGDTVITVVKTGSTITLKGVTVSTSDDPPTWMDGVTRVERDSPPEDCDVVGTAGGDELSGTEGDDCISGEGGLDKIYGKGGNDKLFGGDDGDTLRGGAGRDKLYGGSGADYMYGGTESDFLRGGDGDDYLMGVTGNDTLRGDAGADRFVFVNNHFGNDTIKDFEDGIDKLDFEGMSLIFDKDFKIEDKNGNAVVTVTKDDLPFGTITLEGISASQLTEADFLF